MKLEKIKNEFIHDDGTKTKIIPIGNGCFQLATTLKERLNDKVVYTLNNGNWIKEGVGDSVNFYYGISERDRDLFNAYNYLEEGWEMMGYGDLSRMENEYEYAYFREQSVSFIKISVSQLSAEYIYARRKKAEGKPELVIEVGKRYVTRGGKITLPIRSFDNPCFPFTAIVDGSPFSWTKKGKLFNDSARAAFDLIKEYTPPANTININGYDVPQPVREPLDNGDMYYAASPTTHGTPIRAEWRHDEFDKNALKNGLIHLSKKAVKKHNKALKSFTKLNK